MSIIPATEDSLNPALVWQELKYIRRDIEVLAETVTKKFDDHESRLRAVEQRQWWIAGALAAIQFLSRYFPPAH